MFKCVKTHDSSVRNLVGSANRERRGVAEADTTYEVLSAVGVHSENSDVISSIHSHLVDVMPCTCGDISC